MDQQPLRILSLDGGGIRGISSLYILKELMAQLERERRATAPDPPLAASLRPCEVFDLICGTSTGGLIALMLGRLQMVHFCPMLRMLTVRRPSMKPLRNTKISPRPFFRSLPKRQRQCLITKNWNVL